MYTKSGVIREQNDASSLKVSTGCCATLFTGEDFTGNHRTFCKSSQYVGDAFNDKASSIRIKRSKKCFEEAILGPYKEIFFPYKEIFYPYKEKCFKEAILFSF